MRTWVLVEGPSDRIAVEAAARRCSLDLAAHEVEVVAIGGAQAVRRFRGEHPEGAAVGLCDAAERGWFAAVLAAEDVFVCDPDLEGELIAAVGAERCLEVVAREGDRRALATLRRQAAWCDQPLAAQLRRFIGAGARRKLRYAAALTDAAVDLGRLPPPLAHLLHRVTGGV